MSANGENEREPSKGSWYLILLSGLLIVGIAVVAVVFRKEVADFRHYGYLGAFLISIMAAATIIIYVPGVPVIFALGGVLPNPVFVGLAAGLGEAIGELTGYLAGRGGHAFLKGKFAKIYSRIEKWIKTRGYLTLFVSSAVFNPIFDLIGATAGALRFPMWKFFLLCWAGKTIKGLGVAFLGWWGLAHILGWFDIAL